MIQSGQLLLGYCTSSFGSLFLIFPCFLSFRLFIIYFETFPHCYLTVLSLNFYFGNPTFKNIFKVLYCSVIISFSSSHSCLMVVVSS